MNTENKRPDPFGRLMADDGSQDRYKMLENITGLTAAVGPAAQNNPEDVARVETMMGMVGELDLAETEGPTGYYGERLRQAIVSYQKHNNLPQNGIISPNDSTMARLSKVIASTKKPGMDNRQPTAHAQP